MNFPDGEPPSATAPPVAKKKRKRSEEAAARHRQRYLEILKRHDQRKSHTSTSQAANGESAATDSSSTEGRRRLCKYYYRTGACVHGDDCSFSHDCIPLTSKDLKLCRYYLQGPSKCHYSATECKYSHNPSLFLCRHSVVFGGCSSISRCDFKHMDADAIASLDDAEKLKFCYNNKRFLTGLLLRHVERSQVDATSELPNEPFHTIEGEGMLPKLLALQQHQLDTLPWYLQFVHTLLIRDHEINETS
ncbi:zinc finger protein, putative [Babesia caballi]|uniref:Zinc finger protein, putative n=1 Tax=Babesia caballi TaxID=5871 RepID=A0AAV4M024_BABCB|nr:zinc finger protein, putative [Babesia caballi]